MYDKESDTYYGYSYENYNIDERYLDSGMDDNDMCIQHDLFEGLTQDKKCFILTVMESKDK